MFPADPLRILHLDMDAFYAAIEQLDYPELRGRPVIVGSRPDERGVVATASYEARRFGVHSAMPSRTAYRLCPQGVFMPVRMARYAEISGQVMAILLSVTPDIEIVSIDEAFLDISGVVRRWPDAVAIARHLKQRIRDELQLSASVGVAPNKFLAKLASDLHKPDGLTVAPVTAAAIAAFLAPLPVGRVWGVGKVTEAQLAQAGIATIGQLQAMSKAALAEQVGPGLAEHIWPLARGIDTRPVVAAAEEKSISNENTFPEDCDCGETQRQTLLELVEQVGRRLRATGKLARTGQVKIRFADFRTISRQAPLRPPTHSDLDLIPFALALLAKERVREPVRLLGFGVMDLTAADGAANEQPLLFAPDTAATPGEVAKHRLDKTVDQLRTRFGTDILQRGRRR